MFGKQTNAGLVGSRFIHGMLAPLLGAGADPSQYVPEPKRHAPLMTGALTEVQRLRWTFPSPMLARGLPAPIAGQGRWGRWRSKWTFDGRSLELNRDVRLEVSRMPPGGAKGLFEVIAREAAADRTQLRLELLRDAITGPATTQENAP